MFVEMAVGGLDGEPPAVRHRVARVDGEVDDRILELVRVDRGVPQPAGEHGLDRHRLADRAVEQFRHALHQPVDVDRSDLERMLAREREQALHQDGGALGGLAAIGEPAAHAFGPVEAPQREVEIADDGGQQVVEVVRDTAGEAADRLHLLRLTQCFLGLLAARDFVTQHLVDRGLASRAAQRQQAERD